MDFTNNIVSLAWLCLTSVPWGAEMNPFPLLFIYFFLFWRRLSCSVVDAENTEDYFKTLYERQGTGARMQVDTGGS